MGAFVALMIGLIVYSLSKKSGPWTQAQLKGGLYGGADIPPSIPRAINSIAEAQQGIASAGAITVDQLEQAINDAIRKGLYQTAGALRNARDKLKSTGSMPQHLSSPIPEATNDGWTKFVACMKAGNTQTVTPSALLGMFLHGYRRLEDLGYVERGSTKLVEFPHPTKPHGNKAYIGKFKPPYTLEWFLSDASLQYEAFVKDIKAHRASVLLKYPSEVIGRNIAGKTVTISGLLAVAKMAGLKGLDAFLKGSHYPNTLEAFNKCSGIF